MIDQATNADGDSGRFPILRAWESDDPENPEPTFKPVKKRGNVVSMFHRRQAV